MRVSGFLSSYHQDLCHMVRNVFWDVMLNEAKIWNSIFFFNKQLYASMCLEKDSCCSEFFAVHGTVLQNMKICLNLHSSVILETFNESGLVNIRKH